MTTGRTQSETRNDAEHRPEASPPEPTLWGRLLGRLEAAARLVLPSGTGRWLRVQWTRLTHLPLILWAKLGLKRWRRPMSREFGQDRGGSIGRWYIERYLEAHADDVKGHVLEIEQPRYQRRLGGDRVTGGDVVHVEAGHPGVTIVADLTDAEEIASDAYDCILLPQTIQCIYDVHAAVRTLHRVLRPGGVALVTMSFISQIGRYDMDRWGEYWRFTDRSARRLFGDVFGDENVEVEARGNVLSASALLYGVSPRELRGRALLEDDPDFPVIIGVRAVKGAAAASPDPDEQKEIEGEPVRATAS